jgi:hypothetical protein
MPTVLRVNGYQFYFYAEEGNEPPHIHVAKAALMPNSGCRPRNWRSITVSDRMICGRSPGSLKKTKR